VTVSLRDTYRERGGTMTARVERYRSHCPACQWSYESEHRELVEEAALSHAVNAGRGHEATEPVVLDDG
jgi:hypothetical protein